MCCLECKLEVEGCTTDKLVTRLSLGPGGDGSGVIMRTKLYNLLKAVSGLTSTGPAGASLPWLRPRHMLEIQQESEPTFSLNCVYNGPYYTEIHSHNTPTLTHHHPINRG